MELKKKIISVLSGIVVLVTSTMAFADTGVTTANGGLNLRSQPNTSSSIKAVIPKNTVVDIIGWENNWFEVVYNGISGFVSPQYLQVRTGNQTSRSSNVRIGAEVVNYAKKFIGTPYVYGGSTPSGFDCSGFTSYVYRQFGYNINRTAAGQTSNGVYVDRSSLAPGDLVMFSNTNGSGISHVAIYVGNGQIIHAVKRGVPLRIDSLNSSYYSSHYATARRIIN